MSEQIREQVSAFLDGELPSSETELLLKRLTRDRGAAPELRPVCADRRDAARRQPGTPEPRLRRARQPRHRRRARQRAPQAGGPRAAAALVEADRGRGGGRRSRGRRGGCPATAGGRAGRAPRRRRVIAAERAPGDRAARKRSLIRCPRGARGARRWWPPARLTNYVFAHSKYSVGLGQGNLLSTLLSEDADAVQSAAARGGAMPRRSRGPAAPRGRPRHADRSMRRVRLGPALTG